MVDGNKRAANIPSLVTAAVDRLFQQDTPKLDHLARVAARLLQTPIALISVVGQQQWLLGEYGLPAPYAGAETLPLHVDFNAHVIESGTTLAIDATATSPLAHSVRFGEAYLGLPLRDADGTVFGVIAVIDCVPRPWTKADEAALADLRLLAERELSHFSIGATLRLFAAAVEQVNEAILITVPDPERGPVISYANAAFTALSGYAASELIGMTPNMLQGPLTDRAVLDRLRIALANNQPFAGETYNYRKDGTAYVTEWHTAPVSDQFGRLRCWVSTQRDVTVRSQLMARVQASERRFRDLAASSPDLICIINTVSNRATFFNRSSFLGHNTREMADLDLIMHTLHPDDVDQVESYHRLILRSLPGQINQITYRLRSAAGVWECVENRATRIVDDANQPSLDILVSLRVITKQKQADTALRESEDRYRMIAETAMDAILMVDQTSTIRFANRATETIFGYSAAELVGNNVTMLMPETFLTSHAVAFSQYITTGKRRLHSWTSLHLPGQHRSGQIIPLEISLGEAIHEGAPIFIAVLRDITMREQMKRDLQQSYTLLHNVIEGVPDAIYVKDRAGRYMVVNSAVAKLFGVPASEMIGRDNTYFARGTDMRAIDAIDQDVMQTASTQNYEATYTINGRQRTFLITKTPYVNDAGEVIGLIGVSRDVTERKQLEAQFLQAQKMESIGRLAGGIAHDFNNILTAILGYSDFLLDQVDAPNAMRGDLSEIRRAAHRATALTQQLLTFARRQTIQVQPTDLGALILEASNLIQRLIGESIQLDLVPSVQQVIIRADPSQIEQVLINLAINARDAMQNGGRIGISLHPAEAASIQQHTLAAGRYVDLQVSDSGIGMDEATLGQIFEPFFTTKPHGRGTGLGLATCYGIVKQHGGVVWVESDYTIGTTFHVLLPLAEQAAPIEAPLPIVEPLTAGSATILLVEDEASVRDLVRRILERRGYRVVEASDGVEALNVVEQSATPIDLIVTDLIMPHIGGIMLISELRERNQLIPAIFMSGYAGDDVVPQMPVEQAAFLQKPFTPQQLVQAVRELLSE